MDSDQDIFIDTDKPRRKPASSGKPDQGKRLFIWVGYLTVIVILVAVVANFSVGKTLLKTEMAEHWSPPDAAQPNQAPAVVNVNSQAASLERTYNQVARAMDQVTVSITSSGLEGLTQYRKIGSGVIVAPQHVLTNLHVVKDAASLSVTVYQPAKTSYPAVLVAKDAVNDLAILQIQSDKRFPCARLGNSDMVDAGDIVFSMGNPLGFGNTITSGIVTDTGQAFSAGGSTFKNMFQTNTDIHEGSSGGPLVNISGEVIGINTAIYAPNGKFTDIGFATPIKRALAMLQHEGLNAVPDMKLAAGGCFVGPVGTPGCTLAAATTPFAPGQASGVLGTQFRCPACNATRYSRCPTCRERLVMDPAGTGLMCPNGHMTGVNSPPCAVCGTQTVAVMDKSYARNPYSLAA